MYQVYIEWIWVQVGRLPRRASGQTKCCESFVQQFEDTVKIENGDT